RVYLFDAQMTCGRHRSSFGAQLGTKPGAPEAPVAFDGARRYPEEFRNLLDRKTSVEAQDKDAAASGINCLESLEGLVEDEKLFQPVIGYDQSFIHGQWVRAPAASLGRSCPSVIGEHMTHYASSDSEKVRPICKVRHSGADQPEVSL